MVENEVGTSTIEMAGRTVRFVGDPTDPYFGNLAAFFQDLPLKVSYLRAHLPEDAICLDVGANIGLTALLLSLVRPRGHVYAFEALPKNADFLRRNLRENGIENCTPINCAIGAVPGVIDLAEGGASSHVATDARIERSMPASIRVPMRTLDDFVLAEMRLPRVDFVKMDVEGFEPPALAGGRAFIERDRPPIFMEFNSWCLAFAQGFSPHGFASALFERFGVSVVQKDGSLVAAADTGVLGFLHDNMVLSMCMSDVVLRLKPGMQVPSLIEMTEAPEMARVRAQAEAAEAQVRALRSSTSWNVTAPLRAIRSFLSTRT